MECPPLGEIFYILLHIWEKKQVSFPGKWGRSAKFVEDEKNFPPRRAFSYGGGEAGEEKKIERGAESLYNTQEKAAERLR